MTVLSQLCCLAFLSISLKLSCITLSLGVGVFAGLIIVAFTFMLRPVYQGEML